jgi:acyl-[acyl carrier protein]--UDP-N-acetylglucosamine O-acyltransferase
MNLLKFPKSLIMGKNNYIESGVKIFENVIIGDNNKIYDGTIIYPNTIIGNNNLILNNNILGEFGVQSRENIEIFKKKHFNGLHIGNNNFFHINNKVFSGYSLKTIIGNNNRILTENHIGHDTTIHNNVTIYARAITGGYSTLLDYSTMGMCTSIQQNRVLGSFSMIGMGNAAVHNIFPFYIYLDRKYLRFNKTKIPKELQINLYENEIKNLIINLKKEMNKYQKNTEYLPQIINESFEVIENDNKNIKQKNTVNTYKELVKKYNLPENINYYIYNFLDIIKIHRI